MGVVQLLALTPQAQARLVPSPEPFARRIEYVGDSITCGYGDLGHGPVPVQPGTEDETVAYGALAAAQLDARRRSSPTRARGCTASTAGATNDQMPAALRADAGRRRDEHVGLRHAASGRRRHQPEHERLRQGRPRQRPSSAGVPGVPAAAPRPLSRAPYIVCAESPMLGGSSRHDGRAATSSRPCSRLRDGGDPACRRCRSRATTAGRSSASTTQLASDGLGCDYHPTPKTHRLMAAELVPALRAVLAGRSGPGAREKLAARRARFLAWRPR